MLYSRYIAFTAIAISLTSLSLPAGAQMIITRRAVIAPPTATTVRIDEQRIISSPLVQTWLLTNSALISPLAAGIPDFPHRLSMIRDQIALGQQNGMLSAQQAAVLMSLETDLAQAEANFAAQGIIRDNDWLEQQINLLNQDVSNSMMVR